MYIHDDITLSCVHVSRCSEQQCTWETCGFGTLFCRACQQCWSSVQCWHPSCSPPPALACCPQSLAPEPKGGEQRWAKRAVRGQYWCLSYNTGTVMSRQTTPASLSGFRYTLYSSCVFVCSASAASILRARVERVEAGREVRRCWHGE